MWAACVCRNGRHRVSSPPPTLTLIRDASDEGKTHHACISAWFCNISVLCVSSRVMPTMTTFLSFGGDLGTCGMTKLTSSCDQSLAESHMISRHTHWRLQSENQAYCGWIASTSPTM